MAHMAHRQVPNREAIARFACLDAGYKAVQNPHLSIQSQNNQNTSQISPIQTCHLDMKFVQKSGTV